MHMAHACTMPVHTDVKDIGAVASFLSYARHAILRKCIFVHSCDHIVCIDLLTKSFKSTI